MPTKKENTATESQTLQEAVVFFGDEDNCIRHMVEQRWPDGVMCPRCGSRDVYSLKNQKRWMCRVKHERPQFSIKVGTVMEDSPIKLSTWLPAMWLIANCKNGISSYELSRALDITQKTAWFMLHRIRLAMRDDSPEKFSGKIETDETFIGGQSWFMHKGRKEQTLTLPSLAGHIDTILGPDEYEYGSETGMLEKINVHDNQNVFTIYPTLRGVPKLRCIFPPRLRLEAVNAVARYVKVEGEMKFKSHLRDKHPYEMVVQQIEIYPPEEELPTLKSLRGIIQNTHSELSSEEEIRKIRHEWQ
jgi:transposase-like protein